MRTYQYHWSITNSELVNSYSEPRVLLREKLIKALNNQKSFTDEELFYIACLFPDIVTNCMNPSEAVIKAYIKSGNFITANTFPASVWNNEELVFFAAMNLSYYYLPSIIRKKITIESIKNFVSTHSPAEIAAFCNNYKTSDKKINKYLNSRKIQKMLPPVQVKQQNNVDESEMENENISDNQHNNIYQGTSDLYSSKDISLLPETATTIPKRRLYNLDQYRSIRYPRLFHYITDLHLTNKIYSLVENGVSLSEAVDSITVKTAKSIVASLNRWEDKLYHLDKTQILLIGGDVSFDFEVAEQFYDELLSRIPDSTKVYVVLGNHELWDGDPLKLHKHNYNDIVSQYREFFDQYDNVRFLENELAIVIEDNYLNNEEYILNEEDLFNPSCQEEIQTLINKSRYLLFGGIGFAGKNNEYNVLNGLYRNTVTTRNQEKLLSKKCDKIFKKCLMLAGEKPIICLTHMPPSDWTSPNFVSNCYYIFGHTHQNHYDLINHLYGDNQVGYHNTKYHLKQFSFDITVDYFKKYTDGIHLISNYDYYENALGFGLHFTIRESKNAELFLLKKENIYMFVSRTASGLYILNGGRKKKLKQKDINYYFNNLNYFADAINAKFKDYNSTLKGISKQIRSLGGSGLIHGCIIDIDFYNHVYLNPYDGKITYYCADSINSRVSYDTLQGLLDNNPSDSSTINRMNRKQRGKNNNAQVLPIDGVISVGNLMYSPSHVLNKIQKLFDYNILQIWDEELLSQYKTEFLKTKNPSEIIITQEAEGDGFENR